MDSVPRNGATGAQENLLKSVSGAWLWVGGCGREQRDADANFSTAKRSIAFSALWQLDGKVNLGRWLEVEHCALDPFLSSSPSSPNPSYPFPNGQYSSFPKENTASESVALFPSSGFSFRCFSDCKLQSLTSFSRQSPVRGDPGLGLAQAFSASQGSGFLPCGWYLAPTFFCL